MHMLINDPGKVLCGVYCQKSSCVIWFTISDIRTPKSDTELNHVSSVALFCCTLQTRDVNGIFGT